MAENDIVRDYIKQVSNTLDILPVEEIENIVKIIYEAGSAGKRIYIMGNGGSAATASHFAGDLNKGAIRPGLPRFKAIAFTDNIPVITAWANDTKYEDVFAEQLENHVETRDVVIAISGSGNSPNVVKALKLAKSKGAVTVALTGFNGGAVKDIADVCLVVPNNCMEQVEDIHLLIIHAIATCLRKTSGA